MIETPTVMLDLGAILEPSHRLRESIDVERLGELADSMAAEGLHQPIGVRGPLPGTTFEIVWGHRRYLAARLLRWPQIEAKVFTPDYDPLLASVSENLQRADLTPMDEARAVARFVDRGEPDAAIARLFRRSAAWVRQRRQLLTLPLDLQEGIQAGTLALSVATVLADIDHDRYRAELLSEAQRSGATSTVVEVWRAHYLADRDRIISNTLTVEEIAERRETWRIVVSCDACHRDTDYAATRGLRLCLPCHADLTAAVAEAERAIPRTT